MGLKAFLLLFLLGCGVKSNKKDAAAASDQQGQNNDDTDSQDGCSNAQAVEEVTSSSGQLVFTVPAKGV